MQTEAAQNTDDREPFPLWNPAVDLPDFTTMQDLRTVTHVTVERAMQGGYHYLHESSVAFHDGHLYLCWANHPVFEINTKDELIRYSRSDDGGYSWRPVSVWAEAKPDGADSYNHPVISSAMGTLWGFFTRWDQKAASTEVFRMSEDERMVSTGVTIPNFVPFRAPERMDDGSWIIGGESTWFEAAVAISATDDFAEWSVHIIPRPEDIVLKYPETTLMHLEDVLVAICRPPATGTALVSFSGDHGRTWSELRSSNFPVHSSKMYSDQLSTGERFLIANAPAPDRRSLLSIALTAPNGRQFQRIFKIRHQPYPLVRLFGGFADENRRPKSRVGSTTEWSYPSAVEHDGKLYISYTQGKEDCNLSIIPLDALRT